MRECSNLCNSQKFTLHHPDAISIVHEKSFEVIENAWKGFALKFRLSGTNTTCESKESNGGGKFLHLKKWDFISEAVVARLLSRGASATCSFHMDNHAGLLLPFNSVVASLDLVIVTFPKGIIRLIFSWTQISLWPLQKGASFPTKKAYGKCYHTLELVNIHRVLMTNMLQV